MKEFLRRLLLFSVPVPLLIAGPYFGIDRIVKAGFEGFRLPASIRVLVMGDSHVGMSVDDRLLDGTRNIARNSEVFLYTFHKLIALLKNNPGVDTVCLGASFHNFSDYFDKNALNHTVLGRYFYILPPGVQGRLILDVHNPPGFLLKSYLAWSACFLNQSCIADRILGGYQTKGTVVPLSEATVEGRIQDQFFMEGALRGFSARNIGSFRSIARLCREQGIALVILNTPLHPQYRNMIPGKFIDRYYSLVRENRLELFEFDGLSLKDAEFHPDGDHVNARGAVQVTRRLGQYLQERTGFKLPTPPGQPSQ